MGSIVKFFSSIGQTAGTEQETNIVRCLQVTIGFAVVFFGLFLILVLLLNMDAI